MMTTVASQKKHKLYTDIKVSSINYGKIKSMMGFEVKAQLFLLSNSLIITLKKMNIKLIHTILPLALENKKGTISKVHMTSWGAIQITFKKNTFSLGKSTIVMTLESENAEKQLELFNEIKDWS